MSNFLKKFIFSFIITLIFSSGVFGLPVFASITDGTIDSTYKYAWGENIGWINFGTTEGNVHITDSALTGYAWAENIGWISLNCSNDNSCSIVDYKVSNDGEGNLSGYAWSENTGWINFNPTYGGVSIGSNGDFSGYAWGENIGWIVFNCATTNSCGTVDYKVKTDWRPQSARPACNNSIDDDGDGLIDYPNDPGCDSLTDTDEIDPITTTGGGGGIPSAWFNPPKAPEGGFKILINNDAKYTDNPTVTLNLFGGPDTARMAISNNPEFSGAGSTGQITYQPSYQWNLCRGRTSCPEGEYTVYVKFYASWGKSSGVVSDSIIYQKETPEEKPIAELPPLVVKPLIKKPITEMTIEELKAKIAEIKAMIAQLQAQLVELLKVQEGILYTVAKGETLWQIAQKYLGSGIRWKEIKTPEGVTFTEKTARELKAGQKLIISQK